jgi:hypothetical protein
MYYKLVIHRLEGNWPKNKWWTHPEIYRSKKMSIQECESWNNNIWKAKVVAYKKRPPGILKPRAKPTKRKKQHERSKTRRPSNIRPKRKGR